MAVSATGEKVVILGGGFGSLCAAYELSDPAEPKLYDITLYQLGWRLGGKGASGRNHDVNDRIEEHGIHAFFGFYDNAFDIMQRCYGELARDPSQPLATWENAFEEHDRVVLMEQVDGRSFPWSIDFPRKPGVPGFLAQKRERAGKWELVQVLIDFIRENLPRHADRSSLAMPSWTEPILSEHADDASHPNLGARLAAAAHHLVHSMDDDPARHLAEQHHQTRGLLGLVSRWLEGEHADPNAGHMFRHIRLLVDFFIANTRGILGDGLLFHSVTKINHLTYTDWLRGHGASDFLLSSAVVRGFHDLVFAYPRGDDRSDGNLEAGSALNMLLLAMGWRGSLMWKMRSGMGDAIFAPLYLVLQRRGVKFRFFHRVKGLHLDPGGTRIERVTLSPQVNLEQGPDYHPLADVPVGDGTLPCWPDRPRYEQIVEREELQRDRANLESFWTPWKDRGQELTLREDRDFDTVILGIPVGAHPFLCSELIDANSAWREMVARLGTVQTQAFQLWFRTSVGWFRPNTGKVEETGETPILGAYDVTPMNSCADTSQVLNTEGWEKDEVGRLVYLCGPMIGPESAPGPGERDFPAKELDRVRSTVIEFLENHVQPLWPDTVADPSTGRGFRYDTLVGGTLDAQFLRANLDPSERYVQSFADTGRIRMRADGSGYPNLILAGDWIDNGINIGCIEGTAISGRQAARAISGRELYIPHETPY